MLRGAPLIVGEPGNDPLNNVISTEHVVIQHLRSRPGTSQAAGNGGSISGDGIDAFTVINSRNVMIDHVSASWAIDEVLSVTRLSDNVTVQNSIIAEGLSNSFHPQGQHSMGSLLRGIDSSYSFINNLFAHNNDRNPADASGQNYNINGLDLEFVNNIIYNWGLRPGVQAGGDDDVRLDYIGNVLIAGPDSLSGSLDTAFSLGTDTILFQDGNLIDTNKDSVLDGVDTGLGMFDGPFANSTSRVADSGGATPNTALDALASVLAEAGASLNRDVVDARIIADVLSNTGSIIDSPSDVGGHPVFAFATGPTDTDRDGIPDQWELDMGLNPSDITDGNTLNIEGYTNLELYLHDLTVVPVPEPSSASLMLVGLLAFVRRVARKA